MSLLFICLDVKTNSVRILTVSEIDDAVDRIRLQWQQELPNLNTDAMVTIGRIQRCSTLIQPQLEQTFARFSLSGWEFDVLATLRRSGSPYCLAPTALFSTLMITSGTMTHRMSKLEARGLVERKANALDARSKLVQLTAEGLHLVSEAVVAHVANEKQILAGMCEDKRKELDSLLKSLLRLLEGS